MNKIDFDYSYTFREDGTRRTYEEVEELLNQIPINEGNEEIEPVKLDCTMEEFLEIHGGYLWHDLKRQM